jgi:hypothetical protein
MVLYLAPLLVAAVLVAAVLVKAVLVAVVVVPELMILVMGVFCMLRESGIRGHRAQNCVSPPSQFLSC